MLNLTRDNFLGLDYMSIIEDVARRRKDVPGIYPFEGALDQLEVNKNFDLEDFVAFLKNSSYEDYSEAASNGRTPREYVCNLYYSYNNISENNAKNRLKLIEQPLIANSDNSEDTSTLAERETTPQDNSVNLKYILLMYIKMLMCLSYIYELDLISVVKTFIYAPKFEKDNYYFDLGKYIKNGQIKMLRLMKTKKTYVDHDNEQRRTLYSSINKQFRRRDETYIYQGRILKNVCIWFDEISDICNTYNLDFDIESIEDKVFDDLGLKIYNEDLQCENLYFNAEEEVNVLVDRLATVTEFILNGSYRLDPALQDAVSSYYYEPRIKQVLEDYCIDYSDNAEVSYDYDDTVLVNGRTAILAINYSFSRDASTGCLIKVKHVEDTEDEYSQQTLNYIKAGSFAVINRYGVLVSKLANKVDKWALVSSLKINGSFQEPKIFA